MSRCLFHVGDAFTHMAAVPDASVDLIVTSPPFLALRSYLPADHPDKHLEIGSEATPAVYLSTLLALTREWRRILAPHGSIAIELGDTYAGSGQGLVAYTDARGNPDGMRDTTFSGGNTRTGGGSGWPLAKSLCGLPTLYAWSLAYGHNLLNPDDRIEPWRIRNLIVWHRPNPPVGALGDKVRPSTSYITVAATSSSRWFDLDAERTAHVNGTQDPTTRGYGPRLGGVSPLNPAGAPPLDCWIDGDDWTAAATSEPKVIRGYVGDKQVHLGKPLGPYTTEMAAAGAPPLDAWFEDDLDGDVWTIPTQPYKGAHYATYPPALPRRLIRLMCPRQVCTICGEPRRRITGEAEYVGRGGKEANRHFDSERVAEGVNDWKSSGDRTATRTAPTLGWSDCGCWEMVNGHNYSYDRTKYPPTDTAGTWRRGHVLDPFAGSGTTLIAAAEQGRDATGIDLDPRNLDLARQRIGLFLEEETA